MKWSFNILIGAAVTLALLIASGPMVSFWQSTTKRKSCRKKVIALNNGLRLKQDEFNKLKKAHEESAIDGEFFRTTVKSATILNKRGLIMDQKTPRNNSKTKLRLNVLLVVWGTKSGIDDFKTTIATLESYRPFFAAMVYISPWNGCSHRRLSNLPCISCRDPGARYGYECSVQVAETLSSLVPSVAQSEGVLFLHSDLFLTPSFLAVGNAALRDHPGSFWLVGSRGNHDGRSIASKCSAIKDEVIPKLGWWWDNTACASHCYDPPQHEATMAARAEIKSKLPGNATGEYTWKWSGSVGTWADMYFVPISSWGIISDVLKILHHHHVMNEIAIPSAMLTSCNHTQSIVSFQHCLGSCCSDLETASLGSVLDQYSCGHRINLANPLQVTELGRIWAKFT